MNYDYFISYCASEKEMAYYIYSKLSSVGFSVWFDDSKIQLATDIHNSILFGLNNSAAVISIISKLSINSYWPMQELRITLLREKNEKNEILISFFYDIKPSDLKNKFSELASKSFHKIDTGISELNDLWLAKIINHYFKEDTGFVLEKWYNLKNMTDDFKILKTLFNQCLNNPGFNNLSVVNIFNFSAFAFYLCKKNSIEIDKNSFIAYNYLKIAVHASYDFCNDITPFHVIACKKCACIILRNLLYNYNNQ